MKYVILTAVKGLQKGDKPTPVGTIIELDDATAQPLLDCGAVRLADVQADAAEGKAK